MDDRPPTEMELRVRDAILGWLHADLTRDDTLDAARAAIRAMREPTKEMLDAFDRTGRSYAEDGPDMPEGWHAMIDAASSAHSP